MAKENIIDKAVNNVKGKKKNHQDEMAEKYGGMHSTRGYIKPDTHSYAVKYKKEQKGFNSAKREINKLKKQGK
jgi:peptidoglycan hydrolase-like amidase